MAILSASSFTNTRISKASPFWWPAKEVLSFHTKFHIESQPQSGDLAGGDITLGARAVAMILVKKWGVEAEMAGGFLGGLYLSRAGPSDEVKPESMFP